MLDYRRKFSNFCKSKKKYSELGVNGYTLIEVMIAMTISAVAFMSIYALFAKSMRSDTESRYEIVAAALAQEGIEIIKNKRENNIMIWAKWNTQGAEPSFYDGISGRTSENPEIDLDPGLTLGAISWGSANMQYSTTSKKYEAGCSTDCVGPMFTRECTTTGVDITGDGDDDSLQVVCTVKWKSLLLGGADRTAKTEIILTDWQK